jgi:hypothetical protein
MDATYLRTLAKRCYASAQTCFDLRAKEDFRLLGDDLTHKAEELEGLRPPVVIAKRGPGDREGERS